jgi:hypothetical protein
VPAHRLAEAGDAAFAKELEILVSTCRMACAGDITVMMRKIGALERTDRLDGPRHGGRVPHAFRFDTLRAG